MHPGKAKGKVSIVTGGGYGHIPVFLGYVGEGLCDGAAVGNVFTSPSSEAILDTTRAVENENGVLYLFGNYFGDGMNFEMAAEMAALEGIRTETVKVSDDVASAPRKEYFQRRGIAGICLVYKVAGACAESGASLEEVTRIARKAVDNTASYGVAFSSCTLPGAERPIFEINDQDMEIGMGIHGEPGIKRVRMMNSRDSVSYTHLDVYKRQEDRVSLICPATHGMKWKMSSLTEKRKRKTVRSPKRLLQ